MKLSEISRKKSLARIVSGFMNMDVPVKERIESLERYLCTLPQQEAPVEELWGKDVYVRELIIPAGSFVIGRIHKYDHVSIMIEGELLMWTEFDETIHLSGYNKVIAKAGIKRVGYVLQETKWITAHGVTETDNFKNPVEALTVATYGEYSTFKDAEMVCIEGNSIEQNLSLPVSKSVSRTPD
ncbi:MAG: hypothetical protein OEX12_00175 [Gammaproteobacteria bacterium]|nr:hypothetical protein [Gammaproteobacteria bacterium]